MTTQSAYAEASVYWQSIAAAPKRVPGSTQRCEYWWGRHYLYCALGYDDNSACWLADGWDNPELHKIPYWYTQNACSRRVVPEKVAARKAEIARVLGAVPITELRG